MTLVHVRTYTVEDGISVMLLGEYLVCEMSGKATHTLTAAGDERMDEIV